MKQNTSDTRRFFHYTGYTAAAGILGLGRINCGITPFAGDEKLAVCLTTDRSPDGHGLPEGQRVYIGDPNFPHVAERAKAPFGTPFIASPNLKNVRLTVEISKSDPKLKNWDYFEKSFRRKQKGKMSEYHQEIAILGFKHSASYPVGTFHLTNSQLRDELILLQNGRFPDKSSTWWFHVGAVPVDAITNVERRMSGDEYIRIEGDVMQQLSELATPENAILVDA